MNMEWLQYLPAILDKLASIPWYMSLMIFLFLLLCLCYKFAKLFKKPEPAPQINTHITNINIQKYISTSDITTIDSEFTPTKSDAL